MGMHTSVYRGKRVRVKLKNGVVIVAKFIERRKPYIFLDGHKIHLSDIMSFGIYRRA